VVGAGAADGDCDGECGVAVAEALGVGDAAGVGEPAAPAGAGLLPQAASAASTTAAARLLALAFRMVSITTSLAASHSPRAALTSSLNPCEAIF